MKALSNYIICSEQEKTTGSKLIMAVEKQLQVEAIGPDVQHIAVGDFIIPKLKEGFKSQINNKDYFIFSEKDVMVIL